MECNYGNMTQEILFPLKSLCSKEYGGKLISTSYTSSDYSLMFMMGLALIVIATVFYIIKDDALEVK